MIESVGPPGGQRVVFEITMGGIPGKVSGAWVLPDTRMPVSVTVENLAYGATIEEIIENYNVTREQIQAVRVLFEKALRSGWLVISKDTPWIRICAPAESCWARDFNHGTRPIVMAACPSVHPGGCRRSRVRDPVLHGCSALDLTLMFLL